MKKLLVSLVIIATLPAFAALFDFVNEGTVRWRCVEVVNGQDVEVSVHHNKEKALACVADNALLYSERDFRAVSSERIRAVIDHDAVAQIHPSGGQGTLDPMDPAPPPPVNTPPMWTNTPAPNFTAGIAGSYDMDDDHVDSDGDDTTCSMHPSSSTLPTGVTLDSIGCNYVASTGTSAIVRTGLIVNVNDGVNPNVASPTHTMNIGAAPGAGNYEDVLGEMVGYAAHYNVTCGAGGPLTTVTNLNNTGPGSLRAAVALSTPRWIRFAQNLSGTIFLASDIDVKSNLAIDGRGATITVQGPGGDSRVFAALNGGQTNFCLMYMTVIGPVGSNNDAVGFENSTGNSPGGGNDIQEFWLYHMSLTQAEDEVLAVIRGRGRYTIQSTLFRNPTGTGYCALLSHGTQANYGWETVTHEGTYYRIWSDGCKDRMPYITVPSNIHIYNSSYEDWEATGLIHVTSRFNAAANSAHLRFENNIVQDTGGGQLVKPTLGNAIDGCADLNGNLVISGNIGVERCAGSVFTPPYSYPEMQTATTALRDAIEAEAGRVARCFPGDAGC